MLHILTIIFIHTGLQACRKDQRSSQTQYRKVFKAETVCRDTIFPSGSPAITKESLHPPDPDPTTHQPTTQKAIGADYFYTHFLEMIPWNHSGMEPFLITDCRWDSVNQWRAARCPWSDWFQSIAASLTHKLSSVWWGGGERK